MYKTRGRPEDPWNQEAAMKERSIAETVQVRPLNRSPIEIDDFKKSNATIPASDERSRRRQHYQEFRETYQPKFQRMKEESLQKELLMKQQLNSYIENKRSNNSCDMPVKSAQTSVSNKFIVPNSIKTISVDVPNPRQTGAISLPPSRTSTINAAPINNNSVSKALLMKQLAQTQEQIDEANDQLLQIQTLLNQKQLKFDTPERGNDNNSNVADLYKNNPFARYNLLQSSDHRLNNKFEIGTPFPSGLYAGKAEKQPVGVDSSTNAKKAKENKIKETLKDVNDMITKMQEKYFGKNRTRYRSVSSYMKDATVGEDEDVDGKKLTRKSAKCAKKDAKKDAKLDARLDAKNKTYESLLAYSRCCDESQPSIGSRLEKILQDSASVSMILPPKGEYNCANKVSEEAKTSCCGGVRSKSVDDKEDRSYCDLEKKIRESISSSAYLSREFDVDKNFAADKQSCARKKSVHFSTTETNQRNKMNDKRDMQLNAYIKSALKESLYKT